MSEAVKLVVVALKTIGLATGITVILLVGLDAGSVNLYIAFLSIGLASLAIAAVIQPKS